jgi:hypothetical protein
MAWFVQGKGQVFLLVGEDPLAVHFDHGTAGGDGLPDLRGLSVHVNTALADELLGLAPRADTGLR